MMSKEHINFLRNYRIKKYIVLFWQLFILVIGLVLWQLLSDKRIINPFIFSSPFKIIKTIYELYIDGSLFRHVFVTIYETICSFVIGLGISFIIGIILYIFPTIRKIFDPYLTVLNSLPKVALGPMILIIAGANQRSIIVMAVLINVIVSTIVILNGFCHTSSIKIKLMQSFQCNRLQLLKYLVIPSSYQTIISSFKLGISMSLIGVISGEFLVSKEGLGYLIIYGTQVFNLNLVISGISLLVVISYLLYRLVDKLEDVLVKK